MNVRWRIWLVLFCIVAMLFTTTAEVSHFHDLSFTNAPFSKPASKKTTDSCLLCNGLHAPAIASYVVAIGLKITFAGKALPLVFHPRIPLQSFSLFIRPPPNLA
jgi:hypothetical protein